MTVAELLDKVSSRELAEWMLYFQLEPWGTEIDLYGHAMTTSTLMNIYRGKDTEAVSPFEVMPKFDVKPADEAIDETINMVTMLNAMYGGKDKRHGHTG